MNISKFIGSIKRKPAFWKIKILYNEIFRVRGKNNVIIKQHYYGKIKLYIVGNNNTVKIGHDVFLNNIPIRIRGNNHHVEILNGVKIGGGDILCEGNGNEIIIGAGTSIQSAHINAQENGIHIKLGEECMLSEGIIIRTSDSHSIYDDSSQKRINPAKSVTIGDHVWIAARAYILKGVTIGHDSIIGVGSIVTHDVPSNVVAAGIPAKVKRANVNWSRNLE